MELKFAFFTNGILLIGEIECVLLTSIVYYLSRKTLKVFFLPDIAPDESESENIIKSELPCLLKFRSLDDKV